MAKEKQSGKETKKKTTDLKPSAVLITNEIEGGKYEIVAVDVADQRIVVMTGLKSKEVAAGAIRQLANTTSMSVWGELAAFPDLAKDVLTNRTFLGSVREIAKDSGAVCPWDK